jgi:hypothetical protein
MSQTRREFIVTSAAAVAVLSVIPSVSEAPGGMGGAGNGSAMFQGDPYLAFVDDGGLGGHSWDEAREHALRFRSTPDDRDRHLLGLDI